MSLANRSCKPCRGDVPALSREDIEPFMKQISGWQLVDDHKIRKKIKFKNFMGPMELANEIASLAEEEGHHPDLYIRWGELMVEIWTHKVNGLTESDFVLAAKIDQISKGRK